MLIKKLKIEFSLTTINTDIIKVGSEKLYFHKQKLLHMYHVSREFGRYSFYNFNLFNIYPPRPLKNREKKLVILKSEPFVRPFLRSLRSKCQKIVVIMSYFRVLIWWNFKKQPRRPQKNHFAIWQKNFNHNLSIIVFVTYGPVTLLFYQIEPLKMGPLQFCLPVFLGVHRNPKHFIFLF